MFARQSHHEGILKQDDGLYRATIIGEREQHYVELPPMQRIDEALVTKQPEHGTAEIAAATSFPNFERENIRYRCNQHEVRGQQLNYKSAEKYIGSDTLELLVLLPGGFAQEVHINIDVR